MDSSASTSTLTDGPKPKQLVIDTSNHVLMRSNDFCLSPSSPFSSFCPSPLNPASTPSPRLSAYPQKRGPSFPASRPLRPFPSAAQSIASTKSIIPGNDAVSTPGRESGTLSGAKRPPKAIEISSKWKGGFFVLGLTQAEFSRRD